MINAEQRGPAFAHSETGEIVIFGPFASPEPDALMPGYYAVESLESGRKNPSKEYLILKLVHELGHLVAHRDGKKEDGFDVPEDYEKLVPNAERHAHEWFAEDYGIFLQSDGKKVMRKTIDGTELPNYEARRQHFFNHYFLHTKIWKPEKGNQ